MQLHLYSVAAYIALDINSHSGNLHADFASSAAYSQNASNLSCIVYDRFP